MTDNSIPILDWTGERQVGKSLEEVEARHKLRYYFSSFYIDCYEKLWGKTLKLADIGCGIGYGSYILATSLYRRLEKIDSFDVCDDALAFARHYYSNEKINFHKQSCLAEELLSNTVFASNKYDAITCFEFLEHLEIEDAIKTLYILLEETGILISSLPINNNSPFHKIILSKEDIEQFYQIAISKCTRKKKVSYRAIQDRRYYLYVIEDDV